MKSKAPQNLTEIIRDGRSIDRVIRKATREAILLHKKLGNPIAVWEGGKTVWLKPDEIDENGHDKPRKTRRRNGKVHAKRRSRRRKVR